MTRTRTRRTRQPSTDARHREFVRISVAHVGSSARRDPSTLQRIVNRIWAPNTEETGYCKCYVTSPGLSFYLTRDLGQTSTILALHPMRCDVDGLAHGSSKVKCKKSRVLGHHGEGLFAYTLSHAFVRTVH